ncbi:hypothetical protein Bbelb_327810 [Branchiostoma belcheri]|nr:hypothetical protein Bbelb_327810 [Branchiostoma belcheri]
MWTNQSPRQKRCRAVFLLGALLVILGCFSVVLGVTAAAKFGWSTEHRLSAPVWGGVMLYLARLGVVLGVTAAAKFAWSTEHRLSAPVWGGVMVIATGASTTYAIQKNKHKHLYYLLLGVSVAGMTVSFPQWILSLSGLISGDQLCSSGSALGLNNHQDTPKDYVAAKALHGVCLVLGFAETLVSFSLAILASVGICDNGETSTSVLERQNRLSVRRGSTRASSRRARPAVVRLHLASGCRLNPPPYDAEPHTGPRAPYCTETHAGPRAPYCTETHIGPRSNTSPPPYTAEPRPGSPAEPRAGPRTTHAGPMSHTSPPPYVAEPGPRSLSRPGHSVEPPVGPRTPAEPQTGPRAPAETHTGPRAPVEQHAGPRTRTSPPDGTMREPPPPYQSREDLSRV